MYVTFMYMVGLPHHGLTGLAAEQPGSGTGGEVSHGWPWSVAADAIPSLPLQSVRLGHIPGPSLPDSLVRKQG